MKPEPRFATLDDLIPFYERDYRVSQLNELTLFIDQRSVVLIIGKIFFTDTLLLFSFFTFVCSHVQIGDQQSTRPDS